MGIDFHIQRLVDPWLPASCAFAGDTWLRWRISMFSHFLWLWFLAQHEVPRSMRSNCVPWTQGIWSSNWAVKLEISEIGPKNRQPALTRVGFQCCINNSSNKLLLVHNKSNRTSAAEHIDADQEPVALNILILLLLVQQHPRKKIEIQIQIQIQNPTNPNPFLFFSKLYPRNRESATDDNHDKFPKASAAMKKSKERNRKKVSRKKC